MNDLTVGVRELKARLSDYLQRVRAGQTVVVTERGRPIVRIVPEPVSLEERMQLLAQSGFVVWSGGRLAPREPLAVAMGDKLVSDLVAEGRDIDYLP